MSPAITLPRVPVVLLESLAPLQTGALTGFILSEPICMLLPVNLPVYVCATAQIVVPDVVQPVTAVTGPAATAAAIPRTPFPVVPTTGR